MIHQDDRTRQINALRRYADLAQHHPDLPLPGQISLLADSSEQVEQLARALAAFCDVEGRGGGGSASITLHLTGLTIRIWHAEPAHGLAEAVTA